MTPDHTAVPRRKFLKQLALGATVASGVISRGLAAPNPAGPDVRRPRNILIITNHDGGRHLGCYGESTLHTPAIDGLAAGGCKLTNFFSVSPICSPSRATLFTGTFPQTHGVMSIASKKKGITMRAPEHHLATVLGSAGFHTALFGHQHEASDVESLGFHHVLVHQPREGADVVGREVAEYIRKTEEPFFIEVNFHETHTPYDLGGAKPDTAKGIGLPPYIVDNDAAREWMAAFQGSARLGDEGVRRILEALEESGRANDTLVIFTVDHGIELPRAKWFLYDPGIAVAFICRWPNGGIPAASTCDLLTSNVDVVPTVLELLGMSVPPHVQGSSFASALLGKSNAPIRDEIFAFQTGYEMRCVRTGRYKLIRNFEQHAPCTCPGDVSKPRQDEPGSPLVELYDLESDPKEFHNLADSADHAAVRLDLTRRLRDWMQRQKDPILLGSDQPTDFYRRAIADLMKDAPTPQPTGVKRT